MAEGYVESYDSVRGKLRWGIAVTWLLNITLLTMVFMASVMVLTVRQDTPTEVIVALAKNTVIPAFIIAVVLVWVVSLFSWKALTFLSGAHLLEITPDITVHKYKQLYNVVEEVYIASGSSLPMPKVFVDSSPRVNAYALSTPRGSQIVFTEGIVNTLNREELTGVAAHEWGHILAGDSKAMTKLIAIASITSVVSSLFTQFIPTGKSSDNNKANPIAIAVIIVSFVFLLIAPLVSYVAQMFMSRQRELQADTISVQLTKNPTALASALKKVSGHVSKEPDGNDEVIKFRKSVGNMAFFSTLTRTHPTLEKRLKALQAMGADTD